MKKKKKREREFYFSFQSSNFLPKTFFFFFFNGSFTACAGLCGTAKRNVLILMQMIRKTYLMKKMTSQVIAK